MWFIRNNESVLVCRLYQLSFLFVVVVVLIPPRFWRLRLWRCCWSLLPPLQVLLFGPCWLLNSFWSPKGDKKKRDPVCLVTHHSCLFRDWILIFLSFFFFLSLIYSLTFFFVYFLPLFFAPSPQSFLPRRQKCFFFLSFHVWCSFRIRSIKVGSHTQRRRIEKGKRCDGHTENIQAESIFNLITI